MANLIPSFFRFSLIEFEISFPTQLREKQNFLAFFQALFFHVVLEGPSVTLCGFKQQIIV